VLRRPHPGVRVVSTPAVLVEGVHVRFGGVRALDGVDLEVARGSTLGVLGHNGAGKTTLIRVLTTLIRPNSGRVLIDGLDAATESDRVRRRIGVTGQYAGLDEFLTGRENLELVARLSGLGSDVRRRVGELVDRLSLGDIADRRVGALSGGSRRRIDLAASLVGSPAVLFLDEPTTGLDPSARNELWDVVAELTGAGATVVLTTQYLEEADLLADRIVVIDRGRVLVEGTSAELKRTLGATVIELVMPDEGAAASAAGVLEGLGIGTVTRDATEVRLSASDGTRALIAAVRALDGAGLEPSTAAVREPSLDDVFLNLTGRRAPTEDEPALDDAREEVAR
jgi:ABC-2 type transport system ATP-binding protein